MDKKFQQECMKDVDKAYSNVSKIVNESMKHYAGALRNFLTWQIREDIAKDICDMIQCEIDNSNRLAKVFKINKSSPLAIKSCYDKNIALAEMKAWIEERYLENVRNRKTN